ncbi:UNVERIFIED_CONTAM: Alpha-ketoglutarate-dependent dioxygenase alkB [Sesamum radiatum]|uniref:Alpha-ketoglutarate-dependent dioxygenase alkB n=1 Tax=Sesamum radiatum TaxID=300843 RepID=A0AAW2MZ99_SESRA
MYRSDVIGEESERTAFRKAEKKYKIYYDNTKKKKVARPVDLSEVVDFKSILERYNCNGELMGGVSVLKCDFERPISAWKVGQRSYNVSLPHKKIPDTLCQLAKRMAAPAMPCGEEFQPEAAIVNYFGLGDMLGGHLDDMEKDWSKPIVSMSLGCKAIFLLGGKSREHPPIAMFLRSGDAVLMAGEARECFHDKQLLISVDLRANALI